jgi:hypothetical protein
MPQGSQSNIPYEASNYTAMAPGNVYKGAIDANAAIASIVGQQYVYQNSPAALSVLVDQAFLLNIAGGGIADQRTMAPAVVTLVAPALNSYYAVIYWDTVANTVGVVYGASGVSPTIPSPDSWKQIPLAAVLITAGQTSITSSNIADLRGSNLFVPGFLSENLAMAGNLTQSLEGAEEAHIYLTMTASATLNLTNVRYFTRIVILASTSSSNKTLTISASTPGGVSLNTSLAIPAFIGAAGTSATVSGGSAGVANLESTGVTVFAGTISRTVLRSMWSPENTDLIFV